MRWDSGVPPWSQQVAYLENKGIPGLRDFSSFTEESGHTLLKMRSICAALGYIFAEPRDPRLVLGVRGGVQSRGAAPGHGEAACSPQGDCWDSPVTWQSARWKWPRLSSNTSELQSTVILMLQSANVISNNYSYRVMEFLFLSIPLSPWKMEFQMLFQDFFFFFELLCFPLILRLVKTRIVQLRLPKNFHKLCLASCSAIP